MWLDYHFKHRPEPKRPLLLLWDEFSAHWTPEVKAHAAQPRVHLLEVPGGHTSVCQPVDVAWNAPLKQRLRLRWLRRLQEQVARQEIQREDIKPPKRGDVVRWVADSWSELSAATVANGFIGILEPSPLSEDDEQAFTELANKLESMDLLDIAVGEVSDRDDVVDMNLAIAE
ncbi:unnamed protein product [Phytophthora fragariaefolia]|uniref:Unnamed protein product n=1 Tax=Phytophthora fragariaefolia TaxID=1490495 RepID=A0A9W6Y3V2_9STRA|nr:unnamed protein product [Phytophthora fragariaefolia]